MKNKGFTLIELLVVVLIIGILAAVALPKYYAAVQKTRFAQFITLADSICKAEQVYYMANGSYTIDLNALDISLPEGSTITPSSEYTFARFKNYSFAVSTSWVQGFMNNSGLSYVNYCNVSKECRSYNKTDIERQVCISLGGKYATTTSDYDIYILE